MKQAIILCLLLAACAQPVDIRDDVVLMPLVLSPQGDMVEHQAELEKIADRWAQATGTEISVGDGGVPIVYVDELWDCAETHVVRKFSGRFVRMQDITIRRGVDPHCRFSHNLMHEIGHAVSDYGVDGFFEGHSSGPDELMFHASNDRVEIDTPSLIEVCSHRDCSAFNPEM